MSPLLAFLMILLAFLVGVLSVWGLERATEKGWRPGFWYEGLEALELPLMILWLLFVNCLAVFKATAAFTGLGPEYFSPLTWLGAGSLLVILILVEFFIGIKLDARMLLIPDRETSPLGEGGVDDK